MRSKGRRGGPAALDATVLGGCVATLRAALGGELATQRSSVQGGRTAIHGAHFRL